MKKYIVYSILIITGIVFLHACAKDKGNYDYTELQKFYIDTGKVGNGFIAKQFDTFRLKSGLVFDGDHARLKYSWSAYLYTPGLSGNLADTLSKSENLAAPLAMLPEKYWLEFSATDTVTGRRAAARYIMTVESIGSGLLVLYEKNNQVDCDLIKTKLLEGLLTKDEVIRNLYTKANPTRPLTGDGLAINMFRSGNVSYISLYTNKDGVAVSPSDFSVNKNFKDLFFLPPATVKPQGYFGPLGFLTNNYESSAGFEMLTNDGQCYANMVLFAFGKESAYSLLSTATGSYQASPYTMYGAGRIVVYDQLGKRFLQTSPLSTTLSVYNSATTGTPPFSFSSIGKDLVYLGYGYGGTYMSYGFYKNPVDDGQRFLYVMDFGGSTARYIMDISAFEKIKDAKLFALGVRGQLMYYAVGNKLYQIVYDLSAGTATQAVDAWPFIPAGEEITCIKMCPHPGRNVSENTMDKYIMVGTYNQATGAGKVYMLQVNVTSGTIQAQPAAVFEQFGKVKDISFKF
jgi:hypothetical protein